jgi:uncharacterized membrane protein YkoI
MNRNIAIWAAFWLATLQPVSAQQSGASDKPASQVKTSRAAAEKIAVARDPGTIKEGELEKEHGKMIYSFDIQTSSGVHEVNVDAVTGNVVEDSVETVADEAKEQSKELPK